MAIQVTMSQEEYSELQAYKKEYRKLVDEREKFCNEVREKLEAEYKAKEENIDTWIQALNRKDWRVMFAGWSESRTYFPTEVTKTKVWQIVPVENITWWLKWKTWINR